MAEGGKPLGPTQTASYVWSSENRMAFEFRVCLRALNSSTKPPDTWHGSRCPPDLPFLHQQLIRCRDSPHYCLLLITIQASKRSLGYLLVPAALGPSMTDDVKPNLTKTDFFETSFLLTHGASLLPMRRSSHYHNESCPGSSVQQESKPNKGSWHCLGIEAWPLVCEVMGRKSNRFLMEGIGNCLEAFVPCDTNCADQYIRHTFLTLGGSGIWKAFQLYEEGTSWLFCAFYIQCTMLNGYRTSTARLGYTQWRRRALVTAMTNVNVLSSSRWNLSISHLLNQVIHNFSLGSELANTVINARATDLLINHFNSSNWGLAKTSWQRLFEIWGVSITRVLTKAVGSTGSLHYCLSQIACCQFLLRKQTFAFQLAKLCKCFLQYWHHANMALYLNQYRTTGEKK